MISGCFGRRCSKSRGHGNRREAELRDAIARDEFELHYQPVVDVRKYLLSGVRPWSVGGTRPGSAGTDQFIPLAESTGLIAPLGEWILRRPADAASLPAHIKVAVNISPFNSARDLFDVISRIWPRPGWPKGSGNHRNVASG